MGLGYIGSTHALVIIAKRNLSVGGNVLWEGTFARLTEVKASGSKVGKGCLVPLLLLPSPGFEKRKWTGVEEQLLEKRRGNGFHSNTVQHIIIP